VREAEGGETTPSFGHPSNVRRGKGGTPFGAEHTPPNRREWRFTPTRSVARGTPIKLNVTK